jgi:hypothetical protein
MKDICLLLVSGLILYAQGCTTESLKRTGYETLQNIEDERCMRDLSAECPKRDSYDEYRRKREDSKASE